MLKVFSNTKWFFSLVLGLLGNAEILQHWVILLWQDNSRKWLCSSVKLAGKSGTHTCTHFLCSLMRLVAAEQNQICRVSNHSPDCTPTPTAASTTPTLWHSGCSELQECGCGFRPGWRTAGESKQRQACLRALQGKPWVRLSTLTGNHFEQKWSDSSHWWWPDMFKGPLEWKQRF